MSSRFLFSMIFFISLFFILNADSTSTFLSTAEDVALWLNSTSICNKGECMWKINSTDESIINHPYISETLYYGNPGIAIFLIQLFDKTKNENYKNLAILSLEHIHQNLEKELINMFDNNIGLYFGISGLAFALRIGSQFNPDYLKSAHLIEDHILTIQPFADGTSATKTKLWNNTDIAHGVSGTGLYLIWAMDMESNRQRKNNFKNALNRAVNWLANRAEPAPHGGTRWPRGPDTDGEHDNQYFSTFCCGTSGVAYFIARYAESIFHDDHRNFNKYMKMAFDGAEHVENLLMNNHGGKIMPHEEEGEGQFLYYMGWCGGGTDAASAIRNIVEPNFEMLLEPNNPGKMPWQNLGQCCGASGVATFLLEYATAMDLPLALKENAFETARIITEQITFFAQHDNEEDDGINFPSPEEHNQPNLKTAQVGWMQGGSGIASLFVHMSAVLDGTRSGARIVFPDEPWAPFNPESMKNFTNNKINTTFLQRY